MTPDEEHVEQDAEKKKSPEHSNFLALAYVWSTVALILAGAGSFVYWFFN